MKILHCCLAAFYIDNYGYQENILPKIHKLQGHEVEILTSTETYLNNSQLGYVKASTYFTKEGIKITRIPYVTYLFHFMERKLRVYNGVKENLDQFGPDIIFLHDCQFLSIIEIINYKKRFPNVKIFVDSHTDFVNSGKNWLSKNVLHKIIYKWCAKKIEPHTEKFYGTLPTRCDFLKKVYGINESKVDLLVLGIDDSAIDFSKKDEIRTALREKLMISDSEFVIISGGKLDARKNIHNLMKVVAKLEINVRLIIFGTPSDDMKGEIEALSKGKNIVNLGWLSANDINNYFFASDLAFFPGTHSVLWEQAVGLGVPCVFKKWDGIQHVDLGGNCVFIENGEEKDIYDAVLKIYSDKSLFASMKSVSEEKGLKEFAYTEIAKRAISQ